MPNASGFTTGDVARRFGCDVHHVRRIFYRGMLPEPPRVGPFRLIAAKDLPKVEAALRAAGYIGKAGPAVVAQ